MDQLSKREVDSFLAIREFVASLNRCYGDKSKVGTRVSTKLCLYNRLVETAKVETPAKEDIVRIQTVISGFKGFFTSYGNFVLNKDLDSIPQGVKIMYGDKENISIELQNFIYKSDAPTKATIADHLLTIMALVDETAVESIPPAPSRNINIDTSTPEGQFIKNIISKTENIFGGNDVPANPMEAMMKMFSSGIFQEMTTMMSDDLKNGKMNIGKLFTVMQNTLEPLPREETAQVTSILNSLNIEEVKSTESTESKSSEPEVSDVTSHPLESSHHLEEKPKTS